MANNLSKTKNRSGKGGFAIKPHHLFKAFPSNKKPAATAHLGHTSFRLLDNLLAQYNGSNNGDLCAAEKTMRLYGWTSSGTIHKAITELIATGFIQRTRQGGRNQCSLYAVTWLTIDDCGGKLDVNETQAPSNLWKPENENQREPSFVEKWNKLRKKN